ncbi:MAG: DUF2851 family protein [Bacteroidales bacterium]|nr:DUF2851 family protein [Bacteroidales bacterium]
MNEAFLQYIWAQRLYKTPEMLTTQHRQITVLNPGRLNTDAGPDFFNAQVKINGITWAGNVEIHLTSDDWYRHGHETDAAYNNVILHVVARSTGREVRNSHGEVISEVVLDYDPTLLEKYQELEAPCKLWPIHCADKLTHVDSLTRASWLDSLLIDRLEFKCKRAEALFQRFNGDVDQTFFCLMARALGGKVNGQPMEDLAAQVPVKILLKHNSSLQSEALLLGVAGLLEAVDLTQCDPNDKPYLSSLRREFDFLKAKFSLSTTPPQWKYARLRPQSFPDVRIVQLAALVGTMHGNFVSCLNQSLDQLFDVAPSAYWQNHYRLGNPTSALSDKRVGADMKRLLAINAVIPFLIALAQRYADVERQEAAIDMLRQLPIEHNSVLAKWAQLGIVPSDEGDAQALLHLTANYCELGHCLRCRFGHAIMRLPREEK